MIDKNGSGGPGAQGDAEKLSQQQNLKHLYNSAPAKDPIGTGGKSADTNAQQ